VSALSVPLNNLFFLVLTYLDLQLPRACLYCQITKYLFATRRLLKVYGIQNFNRRCSDVIMSSGSVPLIYRIGLISVCVASLLRTDRSRTAAAVWCMRNGRSRHHSRTSRRHRQRCLDRAAKRLPVAKHRRWRLFRRYTGPTATVCLEHQPGHLPATCPYRMTEARNAT